VGIKLTPLALSKAKEIRKKMQKPDDWILCIGLRGGGCSGFRYEFDFIEPPKNESMYSISEYDGLKVYCGKKSFIFLTGTEVDYEETLMSSGFTFKTPYADRSCGCGESVSFDIGKVQQDEGPE
jgi:iron-sulfur cluster assembly protein